MNGNMTANFYSLLDQDVPTSELCPSLVQLCDDLLQSGKLDQDAASRLAQLRAYVLINIPDLT